jgi:hypothetical protein
LTGLKGLKGFWLPGSQLALLREVGTEEHGHAERQAPLLGSVESGVRVYRVCRVCRVCGVCRMSRVCRVYRAYRVYGM